MRCLQDECWGLMPQSGVPQGDTQSCFPVRHPDTNRPRSVSTSIAAAASQLPPPHLSTLLPPPNTSITPLRVFQNSFLLLFRSVALLRSSSCSLCFSVLPLSAHHCSPPPPSTPTPRHLPCHVCPLGLFLSNSSAVIDHSKLLFNSGSVDSRIRRRSGTRPHVRGPPAAAAG